MVLPSQQNPLDADDLLRDAKVFGDFPGFVEVFADDVAGVDQEAQGEGVGLVLDGVAEGCHFSHELVIADVKLVVADGVGDDEPFPLRGQVFADGDQLPGLHPMCDRGSL